MILKENGVIKRILESSKKHGFLAFVSAYFNNESLL